MINLKKQSTSRNMSTHVAVTQARVAKESITIPYYYVINGVVVTNLKEAQEYKSSR